MYDEWPARKRRYRQKCILPAERVRLTFLSVNKCGVTSAVSNIRDFHKLPCMGPEEYEKSRYYFDHKVVAMWRDPYLRIQSTYRWGVRIGPKVPEFFPHTDVGFNEWVQVLCSEPVDSWYDMHLQSQMFLNMHPLGRMPDICIPWDWPRFWNMFKIRHPGEALNTSDSGISTEWTGDNKERFAEWAAEDIAFWIKLHEVR